MLKRKIKIKKLPTKKTDPVKKIIRQLKFKTFTFKLTNSDICFYCDNILNKCRCVLLELTEEIEKLSLDFMHLRIGNRVNSYILFNLSIAPKTNSKVLAYDLREKQLIYKEYKEAYRDVPPSLFDIWDPPYGPKLISRMVNKDIKIIAVEVAQLYNGFIYSGRTAKEAEDDYGYSRAGFMTFKYPLRKNK